jgi:hypothetical protein
MWALCTAGAVSQRSCFIARKGLDDGRASKVVLSTPELQQAAMMLYRKAGYVPIREERAESPTNKTVGHGIRRFHFEKQLVPEKTDPPNTDIGS